MPGLKDRYMIQLTVQELENLIQRIEHEGGIAYKQDIFNGDYNSLSNAPDLSIYAKKPRYLLILLLQGNQILVVKKLKII